MTTTAEAAAEARGPMQLEDLLRVAEDKAREEGNESMASLLHLLWSLPGGGVPNAGVGGYCCVQGHDGRWIRGWVTHMEHHFQTDRWHALDGRPEFMPRDLEIRLTMIVRED